MHPTTARPVAIKIDPEIKGRVKRLAETRHRGSQGPMREERRVTFRQDAIDAWSEYQTTGKHATMEEADAWMVKLKANQTAEPPECNE